MILKLNSSVTDSGERFVNADALLQEMNKEFTDKLLPVTVFVGIESVIGFIGNFLIVFVFAFYYQSCNYRTFNICLGLIDFTCTLTTMPGEIVTQRFWYNYPFPTVCKTKDFFNIFTVCAETLCLLVIAVDRFRKICNPLKWQITPTVAVRLCFFIIFLAAAIASPVSVFWGIRSYEKEYKNTTITVTLCEKDEKYERTVYPFGYEAVVGGIVLVFMAPMFVLNVAVARRLMSDKRQGLIYKKKPAQSITSNSTVELSTSTDNHTEDTVDGGNKYQPNDVSANKNNAGNETQTKTKDVKQQSTSCGESSQSETRKASVSSKAGSRRAKSGKAQTGTRSSRVRRKALIMFILTSTFICTTVLYFTMISILGSAGNVVNGLSDKGKALFFFFLRFYFIQHIINPILYAILDPQVQQGLVTLFKRLACQKS